MYQFKDIIGHNRIKEHFNIAIHRNKVSHAYILNGESASGKSLLTKAFAKALQCAKREIDSCNECKSCIQVNSDNHPDIIYITHERASISVDDIRTQINRTVDIKPYSGPYKIYIIDNADKMTEQAQNALLKTIEEPPFYIVVILLTQNVNTILPTIQSRCIVLNLKPVNEQVIKEYLMKEYNIPDYMAKLSASFAQGNVGKAIRYVSSSEFLELKENVIHLLKYIDEMQLYEIVDAMKQLGEKKAQIYDMIDLMILWYRDILLFKVTKDPNRLLYKSEYKYISKQASIRDYEGIETIIEAMDKAKVRLKANVNFDIAIELMLLSLKENRHDKRDRG